ARLELQGDALVETSRLAVAGKAGLKVDMDGLAGGGVKASGLVDHGSLELPNGDTFTVDPEQGHYLRFALAQDGTAELNIGVRVLGHDATVSGSGTLAALGPLLSHLKDGIADQLQALTLDFTALATQFLTDARALALTVSGQAVIPDFDHAYTLTLANGVLAISQPDSSEVALQVVFSSRGLVASAGGKWWMVSVDLSVPGMPALLLSDSSGGEWRRDFDFSGVTGVAAL
ncbi:MAG TPA: hypothetical protein VFV15_01565, partial [Moraxellaceae bacterium]|nr:hypothetical protein [Moraxellaceae bacterium]